MTRRRTDLTGYAALFGESFESKVDLLSKLLHEAHYPSLGRYKERLLSKAIRDFIPRSFDVGTGFVLFPREDDDPPGGLEYHDPLNRSAFSVSRQCDIIVYEANTVPPVFRDEDFVVLRPEAVRAVIEVKGSLDVSETKSMLDSFFDFGRKWRTTQQFYKAHHQPLTPRPSLLGLAWRLKTRRDGRVISTPSRIREAVAQFHRDQVLLDELAGLPLLGHLFVYGECDIRQCAWSESDGDISQGWACFDGRFVRFKPNGKPYRNSDRTIADLLAAVHYSLDADGFNRFFSYAGDTRNPELVAYEHHGYSRWLNEEDHIRAANMDTI